MHAGMKLLTVLALTLSFATSIARADDLAAADADKFMAFFTKLADDVAATKTCGPMAAVMKTDIDANQKLLDQAKDAIKSGKKLPADAQQKMMAAAKRMGDAVVAAKCAQDKDVQAQIQRMPHR